MSSTSSALPGRQSHARTSSHSLLTGALNANHRVTRRKSVTNPNANVTAIAAALRESERSSALPIGSGGRRMSKSAAARAALVGSLPSPPASLPNHKSIPETKQELNGSAIEDDVNEGSADEGATKFQKARQRRASDGQTLKESKKSNRVEVRCDKCGGNIHLTLTPPPESTKDFQSEAGSSSPAASGYSDPAERQSSADTTPPPFAEGVNVDGTSYRNKRFSSNGGYATSFQSASAASFGAGSMPYGSGFGHYRQPSHEHRPGSSGRNATGEDDRDLAAAVELLSCSFGSNNGSRPAMVPADAPPVPPLPAQYLDQAASLSASFINSFPSRQPESFTRGEMRRPSDDVRMEGSGDSVMDDDDFEMRSRGRSEDDDDGVFGRMEE
ncbi:hypothetical protein J7337_002391 [Fusarium musae]|uniref:Uncharacterized protein n=1 Tax=Fusarium musae TaxID=1042133 RepID=A0A9P8DPC5_9HYPO|nr:hypothetical protein J7337_002391 [Fusarium musae]KAG9505422.1 hypothetical protein J7337_002391 [Fusarium musae]